MHYPLAIHTSSPPSILSSLLTHIYFLFFPFHIHTYIYIHLLTFKLWCYHIALYFIKKKSYFMVMGQVEFAIIALGLHCLTILISRAVMLSLISDSWPEIKLSFCNQVACLFPYHVYSLSLYNLLLDYHHGYGMLAISCNSLLSLSLIYSCNLYLMHMSCCNGL